ncbi:host attachment protein [Mesorhizobium sp. 2RAF45]|uniref:baeRF12 domain-containing protein n=1 Tax=unclassified Mesorhizobium TaxID=325217 RepID=UPI0009B73D68|nr:MULTISPECIES: host attachment protein [Mesorhizobium]
MLNRQVLGGQIANLIVIAAPRTLGELRKHYHQKRSAVLVGEIPKDLTRRSAQEIENVVPPPS